MLTGMKRFSISMALAFFITVLPQHALAAGGSILYLIAWGGYAPGTAVSIQSTVQAIPDRVNNSNLYYTILSPTNQVVATHQTDLNRIDAYQTVTDEWTTTNNGWADGWYTIRICWSTGNSHSCNIAGPLETSSHFVPTLGWAAGLAGLLAVVAWAWKRRAFLDAAAAGRGG